jgi:hypothetical protein
VLAAIAAQAELFGLMVARNVSKEVWRRMLRVMH